MRKIYQRIAFFALVSVFGMFALPRMGFSEKLVLWDVHSSTSLKAEMDRQAKNYNEQTPGMELEVVHVQNEAYKTKIKVAMGGGTPPDIFHGWGGGVLKAYIDAGMVHPIDEIKSDLLKFYMKASLDPVTFDGKTYGVPYAGLTGVYFWYNKNIFKKLGLIPPKTWTEFLAVGEALKKNGTIPISLGNKSRWPGSFYYMYLADRLGGGDIFTNALYRKNNGSFEDPAYVKAGEMLQDLVNRDFFPKGFNGIDEGKGGSRALMYTEKAGMYLMGTWFLGTMKKEAPAMKEKFDFFPFPAIDGGQGDPTNLIGSPGQNYLSITTTTKNKKEALNFLNNYIKSEGYVQYASKNGYVPPVLNAASYVDDPMLKKIAQTFENAGHVQLYYDQFMSPALGEIHKDLVQNLFGMGITPAGAAKAHENAVLN
ncbi:MAG: extracellular solute-binding protein [SAR324 cluster bacterium]|nr:extracellular solute-binding protein [SAR324 cluster bacterium]